MVMDTVRTHGVPALSIEHPMVTVVAPDRSGLLAEVTGVLALHGLNVRSAVVAGEHGVAVEVFTAEPERGRWPAVGQAVQRPGRGHGRDARRRRPPGRPGPHLPQRPAGPPVAQLVSTQVTVDNNASDTATVVEVRAEDVVGQLHRITRALVTCHLDVTSAKVSTFGSAVVDAFYVRGPDGAEGDRPGADHRRRAGHPRRDRSRARRLSGPGPGGPSPGSVRRPGPVGGNDRKRPGTGLAGW